MKIVLDSIIFELQKAGGISIIWAKFLDYLHKHGFDFVSIESSKSVENIFRKDIQLSKHQVFQERNLFNKIKRYLVVPVESGDIFHSSYYRLPSKKNIKQVVTVHDFIYEISEKNPLKRKIHCYQKYKALKNADVIVCISNHTKQDLFNFYPDLSSKQVVVVYNGVDDSFFPMAKIPEEVTFSDKQFKKTDFILYVGGRGLCKNFLSVIELMQLESFRDLGLKIICIGGGKFTEDEYAMFKKYNLPIPIHLGFVSTEKLNVLYNMAYCLFFPSRYEGFGIPPLEAMKAACPVLAARSSSIPEVVGDSPLLFSIDSTLDMKNKFELLEDQKLRHLETQRSLDRSSSFTWDKTFKSLLQVYSMLID